MEAKEDFEIVEQEFLIILQKALQDEDRDIQLKRERIDHSISEFNLGLIVVGSGLCFLGMVLSYYISRLISKPVLSLQNAFEKVEQGALETRIAVESEDEMGRLQHSFNHMVLNLQESTEALEAQQALRGFLMLTVLPTFRRRYCLR